MTTNPHDLRVALGQRLRAHRKKAGLTGIRLAELTELSQPKISRIETGRITASTEDVERIAAALHLPPMAREELLDDAQTLITTHRTWADVHSKGLAHAQEEARISEAMSTDIKVLQISVVPGLLQNPDYARSILKLSDFSMKGDIDEAVGIRLGRQAALYDRARTYHFLIFESALLNGYCEPTTMRLQLEQIATLSQLPNVDIRLIVNGHQLPLVPFSSFVIYDDRHVYIELLHGEDILSDDTQVSLYTDAFLRFQDSSLSADATSDRLLALASAWHDA